MDLTAKDYTTVLHSVNVMALALGCASCVNCDRSKKRVLGLAALLHDVGKVGIQTELLQVPRQLTNDDSLYRKSMAPLNALEVIQAEIVDTGKFSKELFKDFAHLLLRFYN